MYMYTATVKFSNKFKIVLKLTMHKKLSARWNCLDTSLHLYRIRGSLPYVIVWLLGYSEDMSIIHEWITCEISAENIFNVIFSLKL